MSKTAFITGASRGIGKAIAAAFAKEGYTLYLICNKNLESMQAHADLLKKEYGVQAYCYSMDIGNSAEYEKFLETLPPVDVVVNNAGISYVGLLTDMSLEEWDRLLRINLTSVFLTCKKLLPDMIRRQSGKIINISSVWGIAGASTEVAYSASKGAVNTFTKALAKEVAPSHIQVNAIACGLIDTDMNACFSKEELRAVIEEIPADRIGQPKEVADLCIQLAASPEYMTGQIISLDGGWVS